MILCKIELKNQLRTPQLQSSIFRKLGALQCQQTQTRVDMLTLFGKIGCVRFSAGACCAVRSLRSSPLIQWHPSLSRILRSLLEPIQSESSVVAGCSSDHSRLSTSRSQSAASRRTCGNPFSCPVFFLPLSLSYFMLILSSSVCF